MGVVSWLRTALEGGPKDHRGGTGPEESVEMVAEEDRGSLFECPSCETVYIAIEMTRCSRCDVAVENIDPARPILAGPD